MSGKEEISVPTERTKPKKLVADHPLAQPFQIIHYFSQAIEAILVRRRTKMRGNQHSSVKQPLIFSYHTQPS
jgi:hypothetical protein